MKVDRFRRGQVWWYSNQGYDFDGQTYNVTNKKRPVIIISNNLANRHSNTLIAVPCTTQDKKDMPTHVQLDLTEPSTAMCECLMSVDANKLLNYIGTCDEQLIDKLDECIKISLGLVKPKNNRNDDIDIIYEKPNNLDMTLADINNQKNKQGRKPKYTEEDMIKFVSDYNKYNIDYMIKKYNEVSEKAVTNKVYRFRKILSEKGK